MLPTQSNETNNDQRFSIVDDRNGQTTELKSLEREKKKNKEFFPPLISLTTRTEVLGSSQSNRQKGVVLVGLRGFEQLGVNRLCTDLGKGIFNGYRGMITHSCCWFTAGYEQVLEKCGQKQRMTRNTTVKREIIFISSKDSARTCTCELCRSRVRLYALPRLA